MLFKRISRSDAETAFIVVKNVSGSTMTAGYHAFFDITTTADGVGVTQCLAAALNAYAGCIDATLANNGYGLAQVYGYRSAGFTYGSGTTSSGDNLMPVSNSWALQATATAVTSGFKAFGFMCETVGSTAASTSGNKRIFIRAL